MQTHSTDGYREEAVKLAAQYESITFEETHRDVMHLMPAAPARIADIGAGSGRDAAALAGLGHRVVAAEPTAELRAEGQRIHAGAAILWREDGLPELAGLAADAPFDQIMLTAVWMHLTAEERARAMARLAVLLTPEGRIVLSLRHGPVPEGRQMFDVSPEETIAMAAGHGLVPVYRGTRPDTLGRPEIGWSVLGFAHGPALGGPCRVRPAVALDAAAIGALHVASWRETYGGLIPEAVLAGLSVAQRTALWADMLAKADAEILVAELAGRIVGFITASPQRNAGLAEKGYPGEIGALYIVGHAQRRGIGRALMAAAGERLGERGLMPASLFVLVGNTPARAFYEALGGTLVGAQTITLAGQALNEDAFGFASLA